MEKIDLNDYIASGEGNNGASYDSRTDKNVMIKLYKKGYDTSTIFEEQELARKVYELGVPTPEPGQMITDGERIGIKFRRIIGKRSYARAFSQEPDRVDELSREFARHCKKLHSMECPAGLFPDARESFQKLLDADKVMNDRQKAAVHDFLWSPVNRCTTLLHGDMHFGNGLTTLPQGAPLSSPHEFYFIDLGYFAYGCPLMDLGMTYNICNLADEAFLMNDMHFGYDIAKVAWKAFADEYFFGPEKLGERWFGPGADMETVDRGMQPYALLKLLLVEYNCGSMPENYIPFVQNTSDYIIPCK